MQEIRLPNLGEGIDHGDVVRVLVNKGDTVRKQQTVIELETDKALIEVPCELDGTVVEVEVSAGDRIQVGQVILKVEPAVVEKPQERKPADKLEDQEDQSGLGAAASSRAPAESTAKASERPDAGGRPEPAARAGAGGGAALNLPVRQQLPGPEGADFDPATVSPAAGPATRRLARELGVSLAQVSGSGRGGRVTRDDVRAFVRRRMQGRDGAPLAAAAPEPPDFSRWGTIEAEPLGSVRRTTAEHLGRSWPLVPLVTQFDSADITALEQLRQRFKPEAQRREVSLTITVFLLKTLVAALQAHPRFNGSLDLDNGQFIYKRYYHIGVAVDTPRGLLVPVLRDVDRKDVWQLAAELEVLAARAREGKIELGELRGASFSLSNQGGIGGTHFTPLVNYPETAVLGVGQARVQPVWDAEAQEFKPRLLMPLALSYDHRSVDGADAARFITQLKDSLEDPARLLLGL